MGKQVILILELLVNEYGYVSHHYISKKLNISIRTVARYIKDLEEYLENSSTKLDSKKGEGVKLVLSEEKRKELIGELRRNKSWCLPIQERKIIILCELLKMDEPVKSYYFSSLLKVSMGTVSRDLDEIEEWLKQNNLKLDRCRGNGLLVQGSEESIRRAMANLLAANVDDKSNNYYSIDFRNKDIFKDNLHKLAKLKLSEMVDNDIVLNIKKTVDNYDGNLKELLVDVSYFKFIIFLSLVIQRRTKKIIVEESKIHRIQEFQQYNYITGLVREVEKSYNIKLSMGDIYSVTVNFITSRVRKITETKQHIMDDTDLSEITYKMIYNIQQDLNIGLDYDTDLFNRLMTHIRLLINRAHMDIKISNNYLDEIKQDYKEVFDVVKDNVSFLSEIIGKEISDEEIGYITIHIAATLVAVENSSKLIRAVIVCMSGVGTSKILSERLKQQGINIEVVSLMSINEINEVQLFKNGIDLIISSIKIETLIIPTVVVNPFIKEEDRIKILKVTNQISEKKNKIPSIKSHDTKQPLQKVDNGISTNDILFYLKFINDIMDNFYFEENVNLETKNQLIGFVSKGVSDSISSEKKILDKLLKREEYGSTTIDDTGIILLHCKSDDYIKLGVARLNKKIEVYSDETREEIDTALIMIAPENADDRILKMFSRISKELIESNDFINEIINGTKSDVLKSVNNMLLKFLSQSIINEKLIK